MSTKFDREPTLGEALIKMSIISDPQDQEKLRRSGLILASCQHHISQMLKPGMSAEEVERFANGFAGKYGAKLATKGYRDYKFGTCISINDEVVHGLPLPSKIIPENGLVTIDIMVNYEGLITDSARTWIVGQVEAKIQTLVKKTQEAMWAGIEQAKPGKRIGDVSFAMEKIAKQAGLGNVVALGGHGVGYNIHDEPMVLAAGKPGNGPKIFENMVFTVEPMLTADKSQVIFDESLEDGWTVTTADGSWAAHEEHTVLVTKKGYEVLTKLGGGEILPV